MKNLAILLTATIISSLAYAQKIQEKDVPDVVLSVFKIKFPSASNVNWEMENSSEYEANFKLANDEVSANFDKNGVWLETEIKIAVSELPSHIHSTLQTEFAGFKIEEAEKVESMKNGNCYEVEIEKGEDTFEVLFSLDGKVLSKTKTEEEKD